MRSRWSDAEASKFVACYGKEWGEDLALRTYTSRLLGAENTLVLHGGGNTSVKTNWRNVFGEEEPALFVKASGVDLKAVEPQDHPGLALTFLLRLRALEAMTDEEMLEQLQTHLLRGGSPNPSLETLVHAFLPLRFIDHTHADAILALTNRPDGEELAQKVLGEQVIVLPYVTPGFSLAKACAEAFAAVPGAIAMVWDHHGLITWGETARISYETTVALVSRAEEFLEARSARQPLWGWGPGGKRQEDGGLGEGQPGDSGGQLGDPTIQRAQVRLAMVAPLVRGLLAGRTGDPDRPYRRVVISPLINADVLAALSRPDAVPRFVSPPLTGDHLIRTKALPLWVGELDWAAVDAAAQDPAALEVVRGQLREAIAEYETDYQAYVARHAALLPCNLEPFSPQPRVILIPGLGALCVGPDGEEAAIARDITEHTLAVKSLVDEYCGLPEEELFHMEYRAFQRAKLALNGEEGPLYGQVGLVTGAAGAIGAGICEGLLASGCLVAATDLAGESLDQLVATLDGCFPGRIIGVPLDVTDPGSVAAAFSEVAQRWGGVDLVVSNAGVALVGSLTEIHLDRYRWVEQVNVEGTLLVLAEAARMFRRQGTGGDVVLVSTKNVFAPGASFGAYSSTKAAAHQWARVASLELAADDVRVNMVAPDAVFSGGGRRSGLWAEVGPGRMKARGLDEAGLETYYQNRNLLKAKVTAAHVAKAVLFFATRQTPTTGATLPVDGGLPDATPR